MAKSPQHICGQVGNTFSGNYLPLLAMQNSNSSSVSNDGFGERRIFNGEMNVMDLTFQERMVSYEEDENDVAYRRQHWKAAILIQLAYFSSHQLNNNNNKPRLHHGFHQASQRLVRRNVPNHDAPGTHSLRHRNSRHLNSLLGLLHGMLTPLLPLFLQLTHHSPPAPGQTQPPSQTPSASAASTTNGYQKSTRKTPASTPRTRISIYPPTTPPGVMLSHVATPLHGS